MTRPGERKRFLRKQGSSLTVTIPRVIVRALNLEAGELVQIRLRSSIIEIARTESRRESS